MIPPVSVGLAVRGGCVEQLQHGQGGPELEGVGGEAGLPERVQVFFVVFHLAGEAVGDVNEVLPLLTRALDTGKKKPAPPMVKMKRAVVKPVPVPRKLFLCNGCGYEYDMLAGDPEAEVKPGTAFKDLPDGWVCPDCGEGRDQFIEIEV